MKRISLKKERATAKQLKGNVTPASGALRNPYLKEDVQCDLFVLQHKFTGNASYSLKAAEFRATTQAAFRHMKSPLWRIEMQGADVAVMRWEDFKNFLLEIRNASRA